MFRFVKISLLSVSAVLTIFGSLMIFLGVIVLYLNQRTSKLFNVLEELCKKESDQFGGTDLTTVFVHIGIQAYISVPLGFGICISGAVSIMGAGNLSVKLLRTALILWTITVVTLLIFLIYSVVTAVEVNESYMYCWLSVLTATLQKDSNPNSEVLSLMNSAEIFLECCGVRGASDYHFYSEMFGKNRYPKSCCFVKKLGTYNCEEDHVQLKIGCYYGIRNGIRNRKRMFTFVIVWCTLCVCPLIMELLWMIRGIFRHDHVHEDDFEKSSEESEGEDEEEPNKT